MSIHTPANRHAEAAAKAIAEGIEKVALDSPYQEAKKELNDGIRRAAKSKDSRARRQLGAPAHADEQPERDEAGRFTSGQGFDQGSRDGAPGPPKDMKAAMNAALRGEEVDR